MASTPSRGRFRTLGALLGALALAAPAGARVQVETAQNATAPTQFTNPTHRGWRKRAWRVGLGGNKGRNKPPRHRDRNKSTREVQVARLQRAWMKRARKGYRNRVYAARTAAGIAAKARWHKYVAGQPGYGQVGLKHTERMYRRTFRPRLIAQRISLANALSERMARIRQARQAAAQPTNTAEVAA